MAALNQPTFHQSIPSATEQAMTSGSDTDEEKQPSRHPAGPSKTSKIEADIRKIRETIVAEYQTKGDLFVSLSESYIYTAPGKPDGTPNDVSDIVYDIQRDEILLGLSDSRSGNYIQCVLPMDGWIYLPEGALINESDAIKIQEERAEYESKLAEKPIAEQFVAEQEEAGRRDYQTQQFTGLPEKISEREEDEVNACMQNKYIKNLVFYFRRNPFLPGLIILIIQGAIECLILFDVWSDLQVARQLYGGTGRLFVASCVFLITPYVIAWSAVTQYGAQRLEDNPDSLFWKIAVTIFDIAPIGMTLLFLNDLYHWFECVAIKPIFYILSGGKQIRNISFAELGYYKLRRVAEIFAESMPQAFLSLYILVAAAESGLDVETSGVVTALISSCFVLILWVTILSLEAKKNGMSFSEYVPVVFRGSFTFVPLLPAIERGTPTGREINWTYYRMSLEGVGHLAKSLTAKTCRLKRVKVSLYTISRLHRFGCRYFGTMFKSCSNPVEIVISRLEDDVRQLFLDFDIDKSWSFDFQEFSRVSLVMKKEASERTLRSETENLYRELADSVKKQVWLLDLIMKIRASTTRIPLLDYEMPLVWAYKHDNLNLISFLVGAGYENTIGDGNNSDNMAEFNWCTSKSVTSDKIKVAMALCEHRGVPIVVRLVSGHNLLAMDADGSSDPFVRVTIEGIEMESSVVRETLDPVFNDEDLLFILPFDKVDAMIGAKNARRRTHVGLSMSGMSRGISDPLSTSDGSGGAGANNDGSPGSPFSFLKRRQTVSTKAGKEMTVYNLPKGYNQKQFFVAGAQETMVKKQFERTMSMATGANETGSGVLKVRLKCFDFDIDAEDDYMGRAKLDVDLLKDFKGFHKQIHELQLHHRDHPERGAGSIKVQIYLNVLAAYENYGTRLIDEEDRQRGESHYNFYEVEDKHEPVVMQV